MESRDYDLFDYRHADEPSLSLEEARRKVAALRAAGRRTVYRIVPADRDMTGFRIETVSEGQLYADLVAHIFGLLTRITNRRSR
jgi:hypothetical protein